MSQESKEIYPNAPLQLVAFELRFPLTLKVIADETVSHFQEALSKDVPILEKVMEGGVAVSANGQQLLPAQQLYKLFSKDRRSAVTLQQSAVVVESSHYQRYAVFRGLVERVLGALAEAVNIPGIARVGLRYINEIRVPAEILGPADWGAYIARDLLQPLSLAPDLPATEMMTRLSFSRGSGKSLAMIYGALPQGEIVGSSGPMAVREKDVSTPVFILDLDSAFTPPEGLDDFAPEHVIDICDDLRGPARDLFEASITDELRNEVLRKEVRVEHH